MRQGSPARKYKTGFDLGRAAAPLVQSPQHPQCVAAAAAGPADAGARAWPAAPRSHSGRLLLPAAPAAMARPDDACEGDSEASTKSPFCVMYFIIVGNLQHMARPAAASAEEK